MLYSIKGKVSDIFDKQIIIQTTDFEYEVFVSKPNQYFIGELVHLFLHHVLKEDTEYLVGFKDKDEKNAFKLLLNVQGIGPKSAINILNNVSKNDLLNAISNNEVDFIKSIPGVSERVASQILLDLNQYIVKTNKENNGLYKEVKEALKSLKYKKKDIDNILPKIYMPNATKDELLKEALRRMGNYGQSN